MSLDSSSSRDNVLRNEVPVATSKRRVQMGVALASLQPSSAQLFRRSGFSFFTMTTSKKSLTLLTCLALTFGSQLSLRADDAPAGRQRPPGDAPRAGGGFRGGGPGFD